MWLVAGLGNPGAKYADTRHNIGFMVADALADGAKFSKKFQGLLADVEIGSERVLILKPQTFMNNSGTSVEAAVNFYKIPLNQVIVMHDELDLPVGKLRIKQGGGNNGHNGLRDIDAVLGPDYWRMRLGILHPGKEQVSDHVLGEFNKAERAIVEPFIADLAKHFSLFWKHSPAGLMNKMSLGKEEEKDGV